MNPAIPPEANAWMQFLLMLWELANSPMGITLLASLLLALLNRIYARKPLWRQFEGSFIGAVRLAEKAIPNDTPNKGLARLDKAMQLAIAAIEEAKRRELTQAELIEVREGTQIVHSELEAKKTL